MQPAATRTDKSRKEEKLYLIFMVTFIPQKIIHKGLHYELDGMRAAASTAVCTHGNKNLQRTQLVSLLALTVEGPLSPYH